MAGLSFTTQSVPISSRTFNGGLNSTAGPLGLNDNESSDLQNVDFDKFGSILKRNGYTPLNSSSALAGTGVCYGLHWYEYDDAGTATRMAMVVYASSTSNCQLATMDALDGTWDDRTQGITITNAQCCFTNFLNTTYVTNSADPPFKFYGPTTTTSLLVTPTGLTIAKYNVEFSNYLFLGNVVVSGTAQNSRIYWYNLKSDTTINAADFIDVGKNDGQAITGIKKVGDRLVVLKERSIYNVFYTGDADIPFILPGGGKSNSSVGCVAPFSIQEVENGLVFLSYDGIYYYDGMNSYKISDKISKTLEGYNNTQFAIAKSMVQKGKNKYWLALPNAGQTTNSKVVVWDYFNNAFSIYDGINASAMCIFYVGGLDERPYFADYSGYVYRADTGVNDNPVNVETAVNAYYWTNWRSYDDLCDQKGIPHVYIYYLTSSSVLTFSYSYDFEVKAQYSHTLSLASSTDTYGTGTYGTAVYAGAGGACQRRDLTGRGRVVRFKFSNNTIDENFQIDGFGQLAHLETSK